MALMGGLALSAWKHVRATQDVDLLIGVDGISVDDLIAKVQSAGYRPKRQPPVTSLGSLRILQLLFEPPEALVDVQIDLLLADSDYHREALSRRIPLKLPMVDSEIFVLSCEDLLLHKLIAGRIIDRVDAATLLRANRDSLDLQYIRERLKPLQVEAEFSEVLAEAFPDGQSAR